MTQKRTYKRYPKEFKEEVVSLVLDQGYSVAKAAESVGVKTSLVYSWKDKVESEKAALSLDSSEREELKRLRKEIKELRLEKEILKKASAFFAKEMNPVRTSCRVMRVSRSSYYDWLKRPAEIISETTLRLYRRMKALFASSRNSLGNREMMKKLREEGFDIGRFKVRKD